MGMTNEERKKHIRIANMLIGVINDLERPMLMYQIEKDVAKEALKNYIKMLKQQPSEDVEEYGMNEQMESSSEKPNKSEIPTSWIPISERLPKDLEVVNITWVNHKPEPYYHDIKDKPFTATGVYFNGQWYWWSVTCTDILAEYSHNFNDIIDDDIEIIAWQPLPEPYKAESEIDQALAYADQDTMMPAT